MRKRVEETLDLLGLAELRDGRRCTSCPAASSNASRSAPCSPSIRACSCSTNRPPRSTRPPRRRCSRRSPGSCTTSASPSCWPSTGSSASRSTRTASCTCRATAAVVAGDPAEMFAVTSVAPPVVELGRLAGWTPLPLSVRDARRRAAPLRDRLARRGSAPAHSPRRGPVALRARNIGVRYGALVAVHDVDLDLAAGEVTALMGRNGSGQVVAAVGAAGIRPARARARPGRAARDPATLRAGAGARAGRARAPDARPTCSISTPSRTSWRRPTRSRTRPRRSRT